MIERFINRENQIFEELTKFKKADLDFILVGGYAVSAFNHRFSVDADIVIKREFLKDYTKILENDNYEEIQRKKLDSVYKGEFIAYQKDEKLPINIDILVDSLKCRQTSASWSYDYIKRYSINMKIEGSERTIDSEIPEKELLVAIKLHSGRLTDVRDVVALAEDIELNQVRKHMNRGNKEDLLEILNDIQNIISRDGFEDSFKGVFSEKKLPSNNIENIRKLISNVRLG